MRNEFVPHNVRTVFGTWWRPRVSSKSNIRTGNIDGTYVCTFDLVNATVHFWSVALFILNGWLEVLSQHHLTPLFLSDSRAHHVFASHSLLSCVAFDTFIQIVNGMGLCVSLVGEEMLGISYYFVCFALIICIHKSISSLVFFYLFLVVRLCFQLGW